MENFLKINKRVYPSIRDLTVLTHASIDYFWIENQLRYFLTDNTLPIPSEISLENVRVLQDFFKI